MNYDLDKLRALLNSPEGIELQRFLLDNVRELDSISNVPAPEHPYAKALALESQRAAHKKLQSILAQLGAIAETPQTFGGSKDFIM